MGRVVHFEIQADDSARAIAFYKARFGWEFTPWEGPDEYWLITTGPESEPGINGGLIRRRAPIDGEAVVAFVGTVDVESIDAALESVESQGGTIVFPKQAIPGVGWLFYAKDTEGNIFGVTEEDPAAR